MASEDGSREESTRRDSRERQRVSRRGSERGEPTRRDYLKYGGAVIAGGLVAGCAGGNGAGSTETGNEESATAVESDSGTESADEATADGGGESYTVTMKPVGEVTFESLPETWYAGGNSDWTDMAVSLGRLDGWQPSDFRNLIYFQKLGIDIFSQFPPSEWREEGAEDKETFYSVDPDVFLIDPVNLEVRTDTWSEGDTEEIASNVAPFFGATVHRYRRELGYQPPRLYEAFGKLGEVFQETARYEAISGIHSDVLDAVAEGLPPEEDRPSVGYLNNGNVPEEGKFYVVTFDEYGAEHKQYRDLEINNAFEGTDIEDGQTDYEGLLEADPDVIVVQDMLSFFSDFVVTEGGDVTFDAQAFTEQKVRPMEEHPVGQQITAVQEGRVYPGGVGEQGPVTNLYNTELLARQLYPEQFGEFDLENPLESPEEDRLFDRRRLREIITEGA